MPVETDTAPERAGLDPNPDQMRRLGYQAIDWLVDQMAAMGEGPVADLRSLAELRQRIEEPLPPGPHELSDSLSVLAEQIVPSMTRVSHPRFHAYIPAPGSFYGALGMLIAGGLNPFVGSSLGGASFSALELETLRWIAAAVGYDQDAEGIFTSGGSMANLGALAAARAACEAADRSSLVVYVSDQGHASMEKAAAVLGFLPNQIRRLASDGDLRLDPAAALRRVAVDRERGLKPLFLCANAGTTNTGAIDPLEQLADLCASEGIWFHVDGAYGGFAALSERAAPWRAAMNRADSLTLDPHKWLYAPIGHGCLLVRRAGALAAAFSASGDYLRDVSRAEVNFFDRGPELSRPSRALPIWLLMRSVGIDALRREIEADLDLAALAEELLESEATFEVVSRNLSIVVFRLAPNFCGESERSQHEAALVQSLLLRGDTLVSGTHLRGRSALRMVVMNHRTTAEDVHRSVRALVAAADAVLRSRD